MVSLRLAARAVMGPLLRLGIYMVIYVEAMRGAERAVVSLRLAARTMRVAPVLRLRIYMAIITLLSTSSLVTLRFDTSMTKTAL